MSAPGNPSELVGALSFSLSDPSTAGVFDLVVTAFALDGADMPGQSIGSITVERVPEPSAAVLLCAGVLAFTALRQRVR